MLNLLLRYPGQVDADSEYLWGKPRNRSTPAAHDGTPLESSWVADVYGFMQCMLHVAGIEPSGTPDAATNSQVKDAIWWLIVYRLANFNDGVFKILGDGVGSIENGGSMTVGSSGTMSFASGSTLTLAGGAIVQIACSPILSSGSNLNVNDGADIEVNTGGDINVNNDADIDVKSGGDINIASGGRINVNAGGTLSLSYANYPLFMAAIPLRHSFTGSWQAAEGTSWLLSADDSKWIAQAGGSTAHARTAVQCGGATLSEVSVYFKAPAHSGSYPPAIKSRIEVYNKDLFNGVSTLLGSAADVTAQGVYESFHEIKADGLAATFNPGEELVIVFYGESGSLAIAGTEVAAPTYLMAHTDIRPSC